MTLCGIHGPPGNIARNDKLDLRMNQSVLQSILDIEARDLTNLDALSTTILRKMDFVCLVWTDFQPSPAVIPTDNSVLERFAC